VRPEPGTPGYVTHDLLTQSSLRTYRACPRRYFHRYETRTRPLAPKAETLRLGTSVHRALETWWISHGDVESAVSKLDIDDPFLHAKESAMVRGYHARWEGEPIGLIAAEKEWEMPLVNPETGAASRTFVLAGKCDAIVEA
jgi:hypothetical protein